MKLVHTYTIDHVVNRFLKIGHQRQLIVITSDVPVLSAIFIKFIL